VQADYGEEHVLEAAEEAYTGRQWFTWKVNSKRDGGGERGRGEEIDQANRETNHLLSLPPLSGFLTSPFFLFFPFLHTSTQQTARNVGRVMLWAVTAEKYRPQYLVGMDARFVNMPFLALPRRYAGTAG